MKKRVIQGVIIVAVLCLLVSVSCSAANKSNDQATSEGGDFSVGSPPASYSSRSGYPTPTVTVGVPRTTVSPTTTAVPQTKTTAPIASDSSQSYNTDIQRMIVRTGNLTLVVSDIAATLDRIAQMAESTQGYVVSSNQWKDNSRLVGTITIRVPSEQFDNTMSSIKSLADEVTSENTSAQDVTEEYVDLTAKLKNLEATEAQLLEIMKKAEKVEDILAVQRQLTTTRDDIERTKGRMQYLEQTSETSLITVQLTQSKLEVKLTAISGRNVAVGERILFRAEVTGGFSPYTYKWDFGDKTTSTDEAPVHSYNASGKFEVSLLITDDRGNTATDTRAGYITVQSGWNAGNVVKTAWKGLRIFGQALVNVLIWVGIFSPVWIIVGALVWWIIRRRKSRRA